MQINVNIFRTQHNTDKWKNRSVNKEVSLHTHKICQTLVH